MTIEATMQTRIRNSSAPRPAHRRLSTGTPHGRRGCRRRGVVLILVVAVLGILFVAGAALLNSVTFSTKTLDTEKIERQNTEAVRAIEETVFDLLRQGFLGPDGLPYDPPDWSVDANGMLTEIGNLIRLRLPTYGEIAGVHTWIDLTEPEEDGVDCDVSLYSNFALARQGRAGIDRIVANDPNAVLDPNETTPKIPLHNLGMTGIFVNPKPIMDADGDGIPDSFAMPLPDGTLPRELHLRLADRLRDPNYRGGVAGSTRSPDTLYLSLKVVPHGAMVSVNTHVPVCPPPTINYPDVLLGSVLGYNSLQIVDLVRDTLSGSYLPESEEWRLRHRGGAVMPRDMQATHMLSELTRELLEPHTILSGSPTVAELLDSANRRWWRYDPGTLSDYNSSPWRKLMDAASGIGFYDLNHVLTTISHDDQLIRSGRGPDPAGAEPGQMDWIEWMMDPARRVNFAWDNYPLFLDNGDGAPRTVLRDPRLGRMKFSFPYFSKNRSGGGWLPDGTTLRTLSPADRLQLVNTIEDAFFLLLRNYAGVVDFNQDGTVDPPSSVVVGDDNDALSITAASLAANMIDYADRGAGGREEPTEVIVRDWRTGLPLERSPGNPVKVYGLERQPYITELYTKTIAVAPNGPGIDWANRSSVFAIELYNPYDRPVDLTGYELTDLATGQTSVSDDTGSSLPRLRDEPLSGSIPAGAFKVFTGYGAQLTGADQLSGFGMDKDSIIALVRRVGGTIPVIADKVDVTSPDGNITRPGGATESALGTVNPGGTREVTIQRDTTADAWRFVVPLAKELIGPAKATPGADNSTVIDTVNDAIRPVHLDFVDRGNFRSAFPTTGAMLLLMRHAHLLDPVIDPVNATPFNHVGNLLAREHDQIDNGRMPVFDAAGKYRQVRDTDKGELQGVEALPWGQLIFDYFTALPLGPEGDPCLDILPQGYPPVDFDGLRVAGRININAAPWPVLAGLPLVPLGDAANQVGLYALPGAIHAKIEAALYTEHTGSPPHQYWSDAAIPQPSAVFPSNIGRELAQAIVAYRDARVVPSEDAIARNMGRFDQVRSPHNASGTLVFRRGYGFLTVGELLNVRHPDMASQAGLWAYTIDDRAVGNNGGYVTAVARMVALADWVTTKSHVFTIYGTIRGQFNEDAADVPATEASLREVDRRAIRFQTTVDRLPLLFGADRPARVGSRIMGGYTDVRSE